MPPPYTIFKVQGKELGKYAATNSNGETFEAEKILFAKRYTDRV